MTALKLRSTKVGIVCGISSKHTVSVVVQTLKTHTRYKKLVKVSKKYLVHCNDESFFKEGMKVRIKSCRPISKWKSWYVEEVVN